MEPARRDALFVNSARRLLFGLLEACFRVPGALTGSKGISNLFRNCFPFP